MVLTPDPIVVTTTIVAPTVVNPTSLTPVAVRTITSVVVPTIVLSELILTPAVITSVGTVEAPEVKTGEILVPSAITAVTTVVAPVVRKSLVTLTPDAVTSTVSVIAATVSNLTTLAVSPATTITSIVPPTFSLGVASVTMPVVTSVTMVLVPTFVGSSIVISPDAVTASTTVITPSVSQIISIAAPVITVTTAVTPPNLTIGSVVYSLDPDGRKQISVDQAQGGEHYPFVSPSDDLDLILGDLYLNYKDADCAFSVPFSIKWLRGFGTETAVSPEPAANLYDMEIVDADGNTVFNTLDADVFRTEVWDDTTIIIEWVNTTTNEILRVVAYTSWESEDLARDWPYYFEPTSAVLDARGLERLPPYVTQFAIINDLDDQDADTLIDPGQNVIWGGGYNAEFSHLIADEADLNTEGAAYVRLIQLDLEAGTGDGRFPCDPEILIKQINGVTPDERGNVTMDATDCYRLERPLENVEGQLADVVKATLSIHNDCGPCCDCDSFVSVYEAIRKLDKQYRDFGIRAEAIRDQYKANTTRWEGEAACKAGEPQLQIVSQAFPGCKIAYGVGICNNTDRPLKNVQLTVDFEYGPGDPDYVEPTDPEADPIVITNTLVGCILCNSTIRRGNVDPATGGGKHSRPYKIEGTWPTYTMGFDCINPGDLGAITWVMYFEGCADSDQIDFAVNYNGTVVTSSTSTMDAIVDNDCCDGTTDSSSSSSEAP